MTPNQVPPIEKVDSCQPTATTYTVPHNFWLIKYIKSYYYFSIMLYFFYLETKARNSFQSVPMVFGQLVLNIASATNELSKPCTKTNKKIKEFKHHNK